MSDIKLPQLPMSFITQPTWVISATENYARKAVELNRKDTDALIEKVKQFLPEFRPKYGVVGTKDIDIAAKIIAYDELIAAINQWKEQRG